MLSIIRNDSIDLKFRINMSIISKIYVIKYQDHMDVSQDLEIIENIQKKMNCSIQYDDVKKILQDNDWMSVVGVGVGKTHLNILNSISHTEYRGLVNQCNSNLISNIIKCVT